MKTTRMVHLLGIALLAAGCAGRGAMQTDVARAEARPDGADAPRATEAGPPPPLPMEPLSFPAYEERTLSNGAEVIIVPDHEQPVVTVNLRIKSGAAEDPAGRVGVATFTADLLTKGTESRSAREIAEAIDFVGGELGASAGADWTSVQATVLSEFMDTALVLLSDVVRRPTFPEEELEITRKRVLSSLQVELSQPQALAQRRLLEEIYGAHPYGKSPTPESVQAIQRSDLVAFHRRHFRPDNALFVVAGDVDPDAVVDQLEHHFGDWTGGDDLASERMEPAPARPNERRLVLIHKPGSVQAVIRLGHLVAPATHPDWSTLDVALQVLGGGSTGWLFDVLREEKGYTYGAYARASRRAGPGYFQAFAEVRNEVADSAVAELLRLLRQIREAPVSQEDLEIARSYLVGSFPLEIETPQQVAGQIATTRLLGLPREHLETYRDRVAAVTADDVQRVAREHLTPDRAVMVVVGDATKLHDKLAPFGRVELVDVQGNPLSSADLEVRAADVSFDPSGLSGQTLVYTLSVQGNPLGEVTTEIAREEVDGRPAVRVRTRGGGLGFTLGQDVAFDVADFTPIHARAQQTAGAVKVASDLRLENGRVRGTVTLPNQGEESVDAEVVGGTILPGMDEAVVWLTDFEARDEITVPAFSPQTGSAQQLTITLEGETTVETPAGTFEAYELRLSGGQGSARILARKAAPHYVLRQEMQGQPVVIELKEIR